MTSLETPRFSAVTAQGAVVGLTDDAGDLQSEQRLLGIRIQVGLLDANSE